MKLDTLSIWFCLATLILLAITGCEGIETHHYRVTDAMTGKVYIAEQNNLTSDQTESREIYRHFGAGCTFTLHDGTIVEIDNSFTCERID